MSRERIAVISYDHSVTGNIYGFFSTNYKVTILAPDENSLENTFDIAPNVIIYDLNSVDELMLFNVIYHRKQVTQQQKIGIIFLYESKGIHHHLYNTHETYKDSVVDFLTKPFDILELELRVKNAVEGVLRARNRKKTQMSDDEKRFIVVATTNPQLANNIRSIFVESIYDVRIVGSAQTVLNIILFNPLIYLIIEATFDDGYRVFKELRANKPTKDTYIMFIARQVKELLLYRIDLNPKIGQSLDEFIDFMVYPFDPQELKLRVNLYFDFYIKRR